jgi:hypothetical protein
MSPETKNYLGLHEKCPIFCLIFNQFRNLSLDFHTSLQYQISRKSVAVGVALKHVDRLTGMTTTTMMMMMTGAFHHYVNSP